MDSDCTSIWIGKVLLAARYKLPDNWIRWRRTISEDHVLVVNPLRKERRAVILGFVESDDFANIKVLEDVDVTCSRMTVAVHGVSLINGSHKGQELARDNPVKIAVLYLLIMLVLSRIESLKIVPSKSDSMLETLQTVLDGALVLAWATTCISIMV